jgi:hypothetical protein
MCPIDYQQLKTNKVQKQTYKPNPRKLKYPYLESSYSKEYARNNHLLIKYGITIEEYKKRLDD